MLSTALYAAASTSSLQDSPYPLPPVPNSVYTKAGVVKVEVLAKVSEPWGMEYLPDGRLILTEKPGRVRIFADGKLSEPLTGGPEVVYKGQGGLQDVVVDPDFATNHFIYLSYAEAASKQTGEVDDWDARLGEQQEPDNVLKGEAVARYVLDGETLKDPKVVWRQFPKTIGRGHFGGHLVFGHDGKLYITSGDRQRFDPAQDLKSNLGKTVRINSDGTIPADNPYASGGTARTDIWSMGHRNPLGAAINPVSHQLWIHEMGPRHGDELNIPKPKANFGWPIVSNGDNYNGVPIPDHPTHPEFVAPTFYWHPAISPSGLMFYTGSMFKDWANNAFIGGLSSEALIRLKLDGEKVVEEERLGLNRRIRDVIQAPDGAILVLTDYKEGELVRLTPLPK